MNTEDPRRLFESDEAPARLRTLLQRAHEDAVPSSVVAELVSAVEVRAAIPPRPPLHVRCASWARRAVRRPTRFLLAAVVAGGGAGLWYWSSGNDSIGAQRAAPATRPAPVSADHSAAQAATAEPASEPRPSTAASPAVPTRARSTGMARPGRPSRDVSGPSTDTVFSAETAVNVPGGEEFRLLQAARRAAAEHPDQALKLTDEHHRRFPRGMLAQERDAIAIEALADLGRETEARSLYRAFRAAYPQSPYRSRVERALARSDTKP
jgi:hypothetical protein